MSDKPRDIRNHDVCHHRHDLPLYEGIPSQGILPVVCDLRVRPRQLPLIGMPRTLSTILRANYSQCRVPEPSLKQTEKLIGIFDDERGGFFRPLLACHLSNRALIIATVVVEDISDWRNDLLRSARTSIIPRIKEIIKSGDRPSLTDYLHGEAAQTFIDLVYEVLTPPHSSTSKPWANCLYPCFQSVASNKSGFEVSPLFATSTEASLEHFESAVRLSGFTPETTTNPSFL